MFDYSKTNSEKISSLWTDLCLSQGSGGGGGFGVRRILVVTTKFTCFPDKLLLSFFSPIQWQPVLYSPVKGSQLEVSKWCQTPGLTPKREWAKVLEEKLRFP